MKNNSHSGKQKADRLAFKQYLLPPQTSPVTNLRNISQSINPKVLNVLGDKSIPIQKPGLLQRTIEAYQSLGFVIRPDNFYYIAWQVLLAMIIIYYILEIGLLIGFGNAFWADQYRVLLGLQIFFVVVLVIDMLISPLKAYYDEGLLFNDISQIIRKYIKFQIWIDLIGVLTIMIPLIIGSLDSNYVKILWLLKLYTASRINDDFQRATQLYISLNTIYLILKLVLLCYYYAHFMGIGFYLTSLWVYNNNYYGPNTPNLCWIYNSWAYYQMILLLPWTEMYAYIMYYSIAVVTTIAYGDITPKNPIECIYTIFALIAVTIIFGYILSQILRLLVNVFSYTYSRRFYHFELNVKLKQLLIYQKTQEQIRAHTEQIDKQEQYRNRNVENQILLFLPADPLYGLLLIIYNKFLKQLGFTFIQDLEHKTLRPADYKSLFLQSLTKEIKEERHYIGDIFYREGDIYGDRDAQHSAYFYTKQSYQYSVLIGVGKIAAFRLGKLDTHNNYQQNSYQLAKVKLIFGNVEFLNGRERSHWALCIQNCVLFVIPRAAFLSHYRKLSQSEKEIMFGTIENVEHRQCFVCGEQHHFKQCGLVFPVSYDVEQNSRRAKRAAKLRGRRKTRLRSLGSYIAYKEIRDIKIKITKEYMQKLLSNRDYHDLFVEYQLQESQSQSQGQIQYQIRETQVVLQKIYNQQLLRLGHWRQQFSCDQVRNYELYKTEGNISNVRGHCLALSKKRSNRF